MAENVKGELTSLGDEEGVWKIKSDWENDRTILRNPKG